MKLEYIALTFVLCVAAYAFGINKDKSDIRGYYDRLYTQQTKLKDEAVKDSAARMVKQANDIIKQQGEKYQEAHTRTVNFYEALRKRNNTCLEVLHESAAQENKKLLEKYSFRK